MNSFAIIIDLSLNGAGNSNLILRGEDAPAKVVQEAVLVQERAGVYTLRGTSERRIALVPARITHPTPGGVRVSTKKRHRELYHEEIIKSTEVCRRWRIQLYVYAYSMTSGDGRNGFSSLKLC